jgi:hypothetical protein
MSIYYIKPNIIYVFKYESIIKLNNSSKNSCNLFVIDEFYKNPDEIRNYALLQDFDGRGNFAGLRTIRSFGNIELYDKISFYINLMGYNIIYFNNNDFNGGNCSFTYSIFNDKPKSWIHVDNIHGKDKFQGLEYINMAGVLYLTPNAPLNGGTIFYDFDYSNSLYDPNIPIHEYTFDETKWKKKDTIGNVYNRLILFNADIFHSIDKLFGTNKYDGRLTQNFFFTCIKK